MSNCKHSLSKSVSSLETKSHQSFPWLGTPKDLENVCLKFSIAYLKGLPQVMILPPIDVNKAPDYHVWPGYSIYRDSMRGVLCL
ncbi:hypothetical protein [Prochlorococcus marinus]|uniref:hypothetical protein n=1 Tax=Prochlorococcus marinus TaxID=1219 RepID=UPI001C58208F|nr:hypothetical protein [Prochlorococcus marinus]